MSSTSIHHIAIIMDGNRRWAKQRLLPAIMGHSEGAKTLKTIAKAVQSRGISYLTVYALSTENLQRAAEELQHLFSLFGKLLTEMNTFVAENARIRIIGDLTRIPHTVAAALRATEAQTATHTGMTLTIAIAYGGKDEIVRAANRAHTEQPLTEETFDALLDTADLPPVDLLIRTGGHQRISNFLLWKIAYAELYFTKTFWPAFDEKELDEIITWYGEQKRNLGK